jgi:hypothetical protein
MGNTAVNRSRATFEDVAKQCDLLISVMEEGSDSDLLIAGTVPIAGEIAAVELAIATKRPVIIYGTNAHDDRIYAKYDQIAKLGGVGKVYIGGLFEWLLLQDIYGVDKFPTTSRTLDLYKFRPK